MTNTFELAHVGINNGSPEEALELSRTLCALFNLEQRPGKKSDFAGTIVECVRSQYYGTHGHIGLRTDDLPSAVEELSGKGITFIEETRAFFDDGRLQNIYLDGEWGGFAIHVMQKQ